MGDTLLSLLMIFVVIATAGSLLELRQTVVGVRNPRWKNVGSGESVHALSRDP